LSRHRSATRLLRPRSVAFIGGGLAPGALEICRAGGFTGPAYAVHPRNEGAFRSVADLPEAPDASFVAVNAQATVAVVRELAERGAGGAACYAAGFAEAGDADLERELVGAAGSMAILGPNCYGLINRVDGVSLWPVPIPLPRVEQGIGLVMQSGNLAINVTMADRSLPIAFVLSVGNQAGIDVAAGVELLLDQPETTGIGIYLEGLRDAARFAAAARRALDRGVPIAVVKSGVSEVGARVAATHTSSLAGSDELYDVFFDRLGVARAPDVPAMVEILKAQTSVGALRGRRAIVFTCSGGESALAADAAAVAGLQLDPPSAEATATIAAELPWYAGVGNPLDYNTALWGQEEPLTRVFGAALADGADVALLVIDHPRHELGLTGEIDAAISALERSAAAAGIPAAVASTIPESFPANRRDPLYARGVAPLQGLPEALLALAACARWGERRRAPVEVALGAPDAAPGELLDEDASKRLIADAGVAVPAGRLVEPDQAAAAAEGLGFPVVVKLCSPALPHKADAGAVAVGVANADEVDAAVRQMLARNEGVALSGVLVERMVQGAHAELLVGVKRDPAFGPVVVVGAGGGLVELIGDAQALFLPVTADDVETALRRLRLWPRIARGDVAAAVRAVLAVARLAPDVAELDLNPLFVLSDGAVAADALVRRLA
jgi:acyl-CoA synthetase (NDP forming)